MCKFSFNLEFVENILTNDHIVYNLLYVYNNIYNKIVEKSKIEAVWYYSVRYNFFDCNLVKTDLIIQ